MTNNSSTGGPLVPAASPAPLEGKDLLVFVQALIVGITEMPGPMVRPRFQEEPPTIPQTGDAWAAFGITDRPSDDFPTIQHHGDGDGYDLLIRHEELHVLVSFYDTGASGDADYYAAKLRDGLSIAQNREVLQVAGMGLISTGAPIPVPVLLKQRWLYRVDLEVGLRREIRRIYPVLNIESVPVTVETETISDQILVTNA